MANVKYPLEPGFLAPGMACNLTVQFSPKSLDMLSDSIAIRTEDESMCLQVLCKRDPPQLSLPSIVECGYCLVDEEEVLIFKCNNSGGPCKTKVKLAPESEGVFQVVPDEFELNRGETMELRVIFSPKQRALYRHEFQMVFEDYEQTFTLYGIGTHPSFGVLSIGDSLMDTVSPSSYLRFSENLTPNALEQRTVTVSNLSHVPFEFHWELYSSEDIARWREGDPDLSPTEDTLFTISPSGGIFPPEADIAFTVEFHPTCLGRFLSVARLVVENVPASSPCPVERKGLASSIKTEGTASLHVVDLSIGGSAVQFDICAVPPVLMFPGVMSVGQASTCSRLTSQHYSRSFHLHNRSDYETSFAWELDPLRDRCVIDITPKMGVLPAKGTTLFRMTVLMHVPRAFNEAVSCSIAHADDLTLWVRGEVNPPQVLLDTTFIDFGLIKCGNEKSQVVRLLNKSNVKVEWNLQEAKLEAQQKLRWRRRRSRKRRIEHPADDLVVHKRSPENALICEPAFGELKPGKYVDIRVTLEAREMQLFRTNLECVVAGLVSSQKISIEALVEQPKVNTLGSLANTQRFTSASSRLISEPPSLVFPCSGR